MTSNPEWGPGPWDDEPDELAWRDVRTGLHCKLFRHPDFGQLNGYVGVPPGHALFGWHYHESIKLDRKYLKDVNLDEIAIVSLALVLQVHGGVTWTTEQDGLWWFGFDCGHAFDLSPGINTRLRELGLILDRHESYRDVNYVKQQCADLAFQLKQLEAAAPARGT